MPQQDSLYKTIRINAIRQETKDFKTFFFEAGHGISYKAGQYLTLVLMQRQEEIRRSYSITAAPVLAELLSIGVKRIANGFFSRRLFDHAQPGDELLTTGSGGLFTLPNDTSPYRQIFFFAAGSGITPVFALLKAVLHAHPHLSVVLVYSNSSPDKAVFLSPIQELQHQFARRFQLQLLFSNHPNLYRARLHRDLILEWLRTLRIADSSQVLFYICGPESYMRLCTYTLQAAGIPADNIKREHFITHTTIRRNVLPPDPATRKAIIEINGKSLELMVHFPDPILNAAKKAGIQLPYSCEVGRCGNCVARCTRGSVWHSYNEVLTEKELQQGLVLTCVGHPVGGDITLEIG